MSSISNNLDTIKQFLDTNIATHDAISSNIANAETPNYKAVVPHFEAKLSQAEARQDLLSHPKDKQWKLGLRIEKSEAPAREDGNNVQIEQEVSAMAENSMMYMSALKIFSKEASIAKYAITSGGRG